MYKVNWSWDKSLDLLLSKKFSGKSILNFPCGMSQIGTRADIDKTTLPDIIGDIFNPAFKTRSYDVVICDPPFSYFNRFKWLLRISNIADKYLVLSTPNICYSFKGFSEPEIYAVRTKGRFFLRFLFVYKRLNNSLIL